MAPELYRRAYNINPTQACNKDIENIDTNIISKTSWKEIVDNKKKEIQ